MGMNRRCEPREGCFLPVRVNSSCDYLSDISENGARLMTCGDLTEATLSLLDSQGELHEYKLVWCKRLKNGWTEAGLKRVCRTIHENGENCLNHKMRTVLQTLLGPTP